MKRHLLAVIPFLAIGGILGGVARADQAALIQCIERFKALGISPDAALSQCRENTLAECVKRLVGKNFVATSIAKGPQGNLIDLGNDDSRWLEGGPWKEKGCIPNNEGPKRRQQTPTVWGFDSVNTWFRQAWCNTATIELSQPYGLEDAKIRCELGTVDP